MTPVSPRLPAGDPPASISDLAGAACRLLADGARALLGITGPPGAGKTTLAERLVREVVLARPGLRADEVALMPMDGYHLADAQLDRLGLRDRKGAPETFDVHGYVAALERLRAAGPSPVYVPGFERDLEQPLAAALVVPPSARLVVTEGNYLLVDRDGWERVRPALDAVWFVESADDLRRRRLVDRHVRFGKEPDAARAWVADVDEPNAQLIRATRHLADRVVDLRKQ